MTKSWDKFYSEDYNLEFLVKNTVCHLDLFKSISLENPKQILEVGSGTGLMSTFLSYLGFDVTSLDNNPRVLTNAKKLVKKFNGKVKFVLADAFKIPFADNSFDLCFHQGLLEHFEDNEIIKLLNEQLRVGKTVVLSVPNDSYPQKDFGNEKLLPSRFWEELLKKNFKILESKEYNPYTKTILGGRIIYRVANTMYLVKCAKK